MSQRGRSSLRTCRRRSPGWAGWPAYALSDRPLVCCHRRMGEDPDFAERRYRRVREEQGRAVAELRACEERAGELLAKLSGLRAAGLLTGRSDQAPGLMCPPPASVTVAAPTRISQGAL
jgi:hypothetical protein